MAARPEWTTACPDWEERIVQGRSLIPFAPLFPTEAEEALGVFKSLRIVDLPGKPTFGEACDQWVFDFVGAIFGAYDAPTGQRLITEFFLLISKKNTKSTIAAGIMLTALISNWRFAAELLILAPTIEVANNSFIPARGMVTHDEELSGLLHIVDHQRTIRHLVTEAELKIVSADSDTTAGKKAAFVLVDELWKLGKKPDAGAMLTEATGGQAGRAEGFTVYLSTHSDGAPAGIYKSKLEEFRDIRDGRVVDQTKLPVLYEWPQAMLESEAYLQPKNFYVTNPNLGRSVTQAWLEKKLAEALRGDGDDKQVFLAKHLNVEIGLRLRRDRWRGADFWDRAAFAPIRDLDVLLARSEVVVIGIDGGGLDDLFGFCVCGRDRKTKVWLYWCHAFAHRKVLDIRKEIAPNLLDFERDGDLTFWGSQQAAEVSVSAWLEAADAADDDEVQRPLEDTDKDVAGIVALCRQVRESGLLPEQYGIGVDPAVIGTLVEALVEADFTVVNEATDKADIHAVSQSVANMHSAVTTLARKLEAGTAAHGGAPMMAWCVGNAKAELRGNSVAITKATAGKAKIDPLVAALVATKLMERNPDAGRRRPGVDDWLASLRAA